MKLTYTITGKEVQIGDEVKTHSGEVVIVKSFAPPHKPSSEGKVWIRYDGWDSDVERYASVIGAKWVDREDRQKLDAYQYLPPEFVGYIEGVAWNRGHSAGQDEVDAIATEMALEMRPIINAYTMRLLGTRVTSPTEPR